MAEPINPLNDKQLSRLRSSIEWSNRQLERVKKNRIEAIRQLVGYHYSEGGAAKRIPAPFLKLAIGIYVRSLAPRVPRGLISTLNQELKSVAINLELATNKIPDEIDLKDTLRRAVLEALFGFGVVKCGLSTAGEIFGEKYGETFVDLITADDFFIDMTAKHMSQIQYIGNDYWVNYDELMDSDWFPKKRLDGLKADEYKLIGQFGEEQAQGISISPSATLFKDRVQLRDTWLPDEGILVTYGISSGKLLGDVKLKGPSPYIMLGFEEVPGNLLPLAPVAIWRDLHELANRLFRKLGDQADSEKTIQGFSGGDDESVRAFKDAVDGEGIRYTGAEPKVLKTGGVNPGTLAFFLQCKNIFSYFAGNLDSLGGLSIQSETLGQDRLISEASNAQLRDMSARVIEFSKEIFRRLAYYEWNDPIKRRKLEKKIPGTDLSIVISWGRDSRAVGSFNMFDFDIDVYSLQDDSPATKLQKLGVIMQQYITPLMPAIQQAGRTLDVEAIFKLIAKYSDFPELDDILPQIDPQQQASNPQTEANMPANTTRTYERVNRPGATGEGADQIMMQALLGNRLQQGEAGAVGRPIG